MPKMCERGCARFSVGRVIVISGPATITHHLCAPCKKLFLKGQNDGKKSSDSGTHHIDTAASGSRPKNVG
jgi:hypothetical protein